MKRLAIILLCAIIPMASYSQMMKKTPRAKAAVGIKGGVNLSWMYYSDWHLSDLPQTKTVHPVGGIFVDIPLSEFIGIAPELMYYQRGMKTEYTHYSGFDVTYSIKSRYVDLRLPVTIGVNITQWLQPYAVAGADLGYLLGGETSLRQPGLPRPVVTADLGKANMSPLYLGAFGGLGLRFYHTVNGRRAQLKLEATYNHDFIDSFSKMEHNEEATPLNVNAYNLRGIRLPKGIEISVGVTLPILPDKGDACYTFSRNRWRY